MTAPWFARDLLGRRRPWGGATSGKPNTSDAASTSSVFISESVLRQLGLGSQVVTIAEQTLDPDTGRPRRTSDGALFEDAVRTHLSISLPDRLEVARGIAVTRFRQYEHLAVIQEQLNEPRSTTLRIELGGDYLVAPDVVVSVRNRDEDRRSPVLHASVSCKWTIRSDRVQNVRHEAVILTRHRRGRQPHIVLVTAEPLPSRLASIARGTGEVDVVYHLTLDEVRSAVDELVDSRSGSAKKQAERQRETLRELIDENRLLPFGDLANDLSV